MFKGHQLLPELVDIEAPQQLEFNHDVGVRAAVSCSPGSLKAALV